MIFCTFAGSATLPGNIAEGKKLPRGQSSQLFRKLLLFLGEEALYFDSQQVMWFARPKKQPDGNPV
jgi:hypothetical protein